MSQEAQDGATMDSFLGGSRAGLRSLPGSGICTGRSAGTGRPSRTVRSRSGAVFDGREAEARPLLEAGFAGRDKATFAAPNDLGLCALVLGLLRIAQATPRGFGGLCRCAGVFRTNGNRQFEGTTLNNIGAVYDRQGRYAEALESLPAGAGHRARGR